MQNLFVVLKIVPADWRGKFALLILFFMIIGIFEMLGVASIMPFVALLNDSHSVNQSPVGKLFLQVVGKSLNEIPMHFIGILVLILFIIGNILSFLTIWVSTRFAARLNARLAGDLATGFFAQGFDFLRTQGTTILANYSVREVERAVNGGVLQFCLILSKFFQVILVATLLAIVSPVFTVAFILMAGVLYMGFFWVLRKKMTLAGEDIINASGGALNLANDLFASSREVIIRGDISYFTTKLRLILIRYSKADEISRILPMATKYLIELIAFSMLLILPIYRSWMGLDYKDLVPFIALFAYAGYRLLPNLQQIYSSASILKFNSSALNFLESSLSKYRYSINSSQRDVVLSGEITFENICYRYSMSELDTLSGVSFSIKKGEKVAIVGMSGSGKSTLIDLLLGLTVASGGTILVDSHIISGRVLSWANNTVGYAPQAPLLLNATVAENIAFGIASDQIDITRCKEVGKYAYVDEVVSNLSECYKTMLGVGGSSLSGGEIQRLSIARALYHDPSILILDEPTSALDPTLSKKIFERVCAKDSNKTVIAVTHSWDSLKYFDKIILMEKGRVSGCGTFDALSNSINELRIKEMDEVIL